MISLKRWKRRNRSSRSKSPSLKRREPEAEFSMDALRIGIRAIGPCWPLICAVAVETAKTHGNTQPRRIDFFQFIILLVSKKLNRAKIPKYRPVPHRNGNTVVTFAD